jgi:hypothetical protein
MGLGQFRGSSGVIIQERSMLLIFTLPSRDATGQQRED